MNPIISMGTQSFEKLRQSHSFYIDKSLLIQEWWENQDDVTLVARPRRFFSDLNNLTVVTTTSEKYCTQFGFTEKEVFDALEFFGIPEEKEQIKAWYDGFTFGSQRDIYNPWSITGFLEERLYKPYWANTSSNSLVGLLIRQGRPEVKMKIEDLMNGKTLSTEINEELVFNQLYRNRDAIWSLLLASGYLRVEERTFDPETGIFIYMLKLTNKEVAIMFRNMIKGWFADGDVPYNEFLKAMLCDNVKIMNRYMNQVALETFSSFDSAVIRRLLPAEVQIFTYFRVKPCHGCRLSRLRKASRFALPGRLRKASLVCSCRGSCTVTTEDDLIAGLTPAAT